MKNKNKLLFYSIFIFLIINSSINILDISNDLSTAKIDQVDNEYSTIPKTSGFWVLNFIHINNDNWSQTDLPWIQNRTGTWSDPHIIENVTIDAYDLGNGILIENSNEYFIIRNTTVFNASSSSWIAGIKLYNTHNGTLFKNNVSNNGLYGILVQISDNNTVLNNTANDNYRGIHMDSGDNNTVINNTVFTNGEYGISASGSADLRIENNIVGNNTQYGIDIYQDEWVEISGNTLINNGFSYYRGISTPNSCKLYTNNTVNGKPVYYYYGENGLNSNNFTNAGQVILDMCSDSEINGLDISFASQGIIMHHSDNNTIRNNYIHDNYRGIYIGLYNDNNTIINNTFDNNRNGIMMYTEDRDNNVTSNTITNSQNFGIFLLTISEGNLIFNNNISNPAQAGIQAQGGSSSNTTILNNTITGGGNAGIYIFNNINNFLVKGNIIINARDGISLFNSGENNITENNITGTTRYGIYLRSNCDNNTISKNNVSNGSFGARIDDNTMEDNLFFENIFTGNAVNAQDFSDAGDNQWNKTDIGNFWHDYTGWDCDSDGIGETPYTNIGGSANSQDNYPIWTLPDPNDPIISENNINNWDLFGVSAPVFNLDITEYQLNDTWYGLWNGSMLTANYSFIYIPSVDTDFNQTLWDQVGNGTVTISFYANDTCGNWNFLNITVRKDIRAPDLNILNPLNNAIRAKANRVFNFTIVEINLDTMWYSIAGGQDIIFTVNDTFNQADWDAAWDATAYNSAFLIRFYTNDTAGNIVIIDIWIKPDKEGPGDPGNGPDAIMIVIIIVLIAAIAIPVIYVIYKKKFAEERP